MVGAALSFRAYTRIVARYCEGSTISAFDLKPIRMPSPVASRSTFNEVISLINAGRLVEAIERCRQCVASNAEDVTMVALLGATLLKTGQRKEAETQLRQAIALAPTFAKPLEDLGFLLVESGRASEAIEILERATRLDPKSELAFTSLGRAYAANGRGADADRAFESAFELNPERKRLAFAAEHQKHGRLDEAEREYRELLNRNPRHVDALRLLASLQFGKLRFDDAERLLRRAIEIAPDYTLARLDLGRALHEQYRYAEAIRQFDDVIAAEPQRPKAYYLKAASLAPMGETKEALAMYRKALELRPSHVGAWLGAGHTLKTLGHQDEAVEAYRECIRLRPDNGEPWWSMANLKTFRFNDDDHVALRSALDRSEEVQGSSRVNFLFALAKACEDRGDFETAWGYYQEGNQQQRAAERYDAVQTETTNDDLIDVFDRPFLESRAGQGCDDPSPIFIVGLPRSGSTLLEQILASHSEVEGTSELPYIGRVATSLNHNPAEGVNYPRAMQELGPEHLQALGRTYLQRAGAHRMTDRPRFIDKMPNNFPSAGFIHSILPNAKIIDARRYPLDATLSCYRQLFAKGQSFVYDLQDIGDYFLEYQRMMDHWHEVMPGKVLTVQYEEVVTDQEAQVRRLLEFCELPWEDACMDFHKTRRAVRTASSEQVRQPVYTSSVHYWRNYQAWLDELIDVLQPVLPRYAQYESINR